MYFSLLGKWVEAHSDLATACKLDYDDVANEWLKEVEPNVSLVFFLCGVFMKSAVITMKAKRLFLHEQEFYKLCEAETHFLPCRWKSDSLND
ncbi:hypothetical protein Y032_0003g1503 [Ancylostoma ceylanicum]|uniref:Tetratricopeptide repeat protein n=1 Tax=Ancylostoma ceylanicum TaxID=53326 RepID=A0A016VXZ8_9BILA|nr:hypothetical protein Y032_0003g1503 [Ancylostoma ceylanicum]